jgi:hypothetical protein
MRPRAFGDHAEMHSEEDDVAEHKQHKKRQSAGVGAASAKTKEGRTRPTNNQLL